MGRSSVFSLEQIYRKQVTQTWSKIPEVFRYVNSLATTGGTAYGYWGGGIGPSNLSSVDRIDYTNDATNMVTKGPLTEVGYYLVGISSPSYGYTCGNLYPGYKSTVQRADYANDTATAVVKGPLTRSDGSASGLNSRSYGYFAGGQNPGNNSYVDRIDFSNDSSTASPKGNLDTGRGKCAGTSNQSYGWATGGIEPGTTKVSRIDFSNDTATSSPKGEMVTARMGHSGSGNADYGYQAGGNNNYKSSVDRIDYSNDTATAVEKGPLSIGRRYVDGVSSPSYGWHAGGETPAKISTCDRIDYSNDTATAVVKGSLTSAKAWFMGNHSAQSNDLPTPQGMVPATRSESYPNPAAGPAFGYFGGGDATLSTIDRVDYSNDTAVAAAKGPLADARYALAGTSSKDYGYFGGGYSPAGGGTRWSRIDRIDYASDGSTALVKGNMTSGRSSVYGTGNLSYGYFGGGATDIYAAMTNIDRVDYSNDTPTASPKGPLSVQRGRSCALGTLSYGYFTGGNDNTPGYPVISSVDRLDYASDSSTTVLKGNLTIARKSIGGAGNSSYGYLSGGRVDSPSLAYFSTIDRIDYSSDTSTASPKGSLSAATSYRTGTGDASYGYMGGGQIVSPSSPYTKTSSVERIDYSNDTAIASPKGPLTVIQYAAGGASALDNAKPNPTNKTVDKGSDGYTVGSQGPAMGYTLGSGSNVQRIDYTNDTATAPTKGPLSASISYHSAVSSNSHAYTFGGSPSPSYRSIIMRVDYANDTATAPTVANLAQPVYRTYSGMGNKTYGYQSGGQRPSGTGTTNIDRIEYASDTSTGLLKGNLTASRYLQTAVGNLSYGYVCGGSPPAPNNSRVQRVDYANDTATAPDKGPLHQGSRKLSSAGTADYGYVAGGTSPELSSTTRIDYSNDTATSVQKGPMTRTRRNFGGMSSPEYAYFTAGAMPWPQTDLTSTDRLDYANDTATASPKGPLSAAVSYFSAASPRDIAGSLGTTPTFIPRIRWVDNASETPAVIAGPAYGYFSGGGTDPSIPAPSPSLTSSSNRIDYSNDTETAATKAPLTRGKRGLGAVGNLSHGYVTGSEGFPLSGAQEKSEVDRIDYSNDTATAVAKGPLTAVTGYGSNVGNKNYGYTTLGPSNDKSHIGRIDYSNDTATVQVKSKFNTTGWDRAATGNLSYGYWGGMVGTGTPRHSSVERLDYSNDTADAVQKGHIHANPSGGLYGMGAAGNSSYGYWAGGSPGHYSYVSRIDYSNDSAAATPKGNLTIARTGYSATGSANFGYFAGNYPSALSSVDRIDYSNDTATASPKGPLSASLSYMGGHSALANGFPQTSTAAVAAPVQPPFSYPVQLPAPGPAYGYHLGGGIPGSVSTVDRIDFGNDTATASTKGPLSVARHSAASTGTKDYGYGCGGRANPGSQYSTVDRVDYGNDTVTTVVKGPLASTSNYNSSVYGNLSYGYIHASPDSVTTLQRIEYANDTATSTPKGNLAAAKYAHSQGAGNSSYGYLAGGYSSTSVNQRIDYSNDTATAVAKGNLSVARYALGATGNSSYGYFSSGNSGPAALSVVDRLDYSNDTAAMATKGPLSSARYAALGLGSPSYGYISGGREPNPVGQISKVDRIEYSNDTATASPKGPLTAARRYSFGVSGQANGFPN